MRKVTTHPCPPRAPGKGRFRGSKKRGKPGGLFIDSGGELCCVVLCCVLFCFVCPFTQRPRFLPELANQKQQEETLWSDWGKRHRLGAAAELCGRGGPSEERQRSRDVLVETGPDWERGRSSRPRPSCASTTEPMVFILYLVQSEHGQRSPHLPKAPCRAPGEGCGSPPPAPSVVLAAHGWGWLCPVPSESQIQTRGLKTG